MTLVKLAASAALAAMLAAPSFAQEKKDDYVRPYWWDKPVVEGLGRALIEVEPNRASFSVTFVETDAESGEATKKAVARARIAYDAIKKIAANKSRVTTSVNVTPFYEQYRDKDGNIQTNTREDKVKGYEARAVVNVNLTDVALAGRARAAALALGPQDSGRISIYLEQTTEMQRKAIEEAAKDAHDRAKLTATAAGMKLGDLLVLQEGNGPCMGNWSTSQVARVRGGNGGDNYYPSSPVMSPPPPPPAPAAMASGRVGTKTVTITEQDVANLDLPSEQNIQTISSSMCAVYTLVK